MKKTKQENTIFNNQQNNIQQNLSDYTFKEAMLEMKLRYDLSITDDELKFM